MSQRQFEPLSGGRSGIDWGITALMVAVFLTGSVWFTHGNKYPSFYHPEEETRASQIISGAWDLHRPLLFAITTSFMKAGFHVSDDIQSVTELGRTVSALFAVASIVCLALAAYFIRNWAAAALLSFLLLSQHQFFDFAHSMNENTSLMFGASLTLLAIVLLERKPTVARSLFLGCSVAIAVSAKYVGVLLFIPALIVVLRSGGKELRGHRIAEFALGFLFAILVINFSAVTQLPVAAMDVMQDLAQALGSTPAGFMSLLRGNFWIALWHNTTPLIWVMISLSIWVLWLRRNKLTMSEILLVLIPVFYFLLLLFSPPESDLHFLPMIGFTYAFAVTGAASVADLIATRSEPVRGWLFPALLALCLTACFVELLRGFPYFIAFNQDDRLEMLTWMDGNLQPGSGVIADPTVLLPSLLAESKQKYRFNLVKNEIAIAPDDPRPLDQIVAAGADYAVVSKSDYDRFFSHVASVAQANDPSFGAGRQFYSDVLKKGTLVWRRDRGVVMYLQPGLAIYRLPKPGEPAKRLSGAE